MLNIRTFVCNLWQENTMILALEGSNEAVIVDPGCMPGKERDTMLQFLQQNELTPCAVLLTHAHPDHIFSAKALQDKFGIPVYMDPAEKATIEAARRKAAAYPEFEPDFVATPVSDGQELTLAGISFKVITTPGHTPGGVCYLDEEHRALFTGDTLFAGTIGRTDMEGGDYDKLIVSVMDKLMGLDGDIEIFPGHSHSSTISDERTGNPFLQPFNEAEEGIPEDEVEPVFISR